MIVVDASAVIAALASPDPDRRLLERLRAASELRAPHLVDIELLHALRRLVARRELTADRAADVRADYDDLLVVRHPHGPLADRIWQLRDSVTAYDAAYVALAEALDVPLVTCDARLAAAPGTTARMEVFHAT